MGIKSQRKTAPTLCKGPSGGLLTPSLKVGVMLCEANVRAAMAAPLLPDLTARVVAS